MFDEEVLLPLSALQHLVFCERQFALMHIEQVWQENVLTIEGRQLHELVDAGEGEVREGIRIARSVPLCSLRLGLVGKADVVELRPADVGAVVPGIRGSWSPYPVEYKRGRPKPHRADEVQVCAQGMCLEEMLGVAVPRGALFYGKTRRRQEVEFDAGLRGLVEWAARRARELIAVAATPRVRREPKCDSCSLLDLCRPDVLARSARRFIDDELNEAIGPTDESSEVSR